MSELYSQLMQDTNLVLVTPELKAKAAQDQKGQLEVIPAQERTYLIVTAIHKDRSKNIVNRISCKKGVPLGGYTYDAQTDSYHFDCADYLHLGYIPFSVLLRVKGLDWEMRVPLAEPVIKKFLTNLQKRELKNFRNHFKTDEFSIQFIQMIDPN